MEPNCRPWASFCTTCPSPYAPLAHAANEDKHCPVEKGHGSGAFGEGVDLEERTRGYPRTLALPPGTDALVLAPGGIWKSQSFWGLLGAYQGGWVLSGRAQRAWAEVTSEEWALQPHWSPHSRAAWCGTLLGALLLQPRALGDTRLELTLLWVSASILLARLTPDRPVQQTEQYFCSGGLPAVREVVWKPPHLAVSQLQETWPLVHGGWACGLLFTQPQSPNTGLCFTALRSCLRPLACPLLLEDQLPGPRELWSYWARRPAVSYPQG